MNAVQSPINALGEPIDQQTLNQMLRIAYWERIFGSISHERIQVKIDSLVALGAMMTEAIE